MRNKMCKRCRETEIQLIEYERRLAFAEQRLEYQETQMRALFSVVREFSVQFSHIAAVSKKFFGGGQNKLTPDVK